MSVSNPRGWQKVKWKEAEKGFQRILLSDLNKKEEKMFLNIFMDVQESFIRDLPAREAPAMPFVTGNLHDSIVGVTSLDGRVVRASYPQPAAVTTSSITGKTIFSPTSGMGRKRIIGSVAAETLVRNMNGRYPHGIAMSLFIGVPYAMRPQLKGRHAGYMDVLLQNFEYALASDFRAAERMGLLKIKGITLENIVQLQYDPEDMRVFTEPKRRGRPKGSGTKMASYGSGMGMKLLP